MTRPSHRLVWQATFVPPAWPVAARRAAWRWGRRLVWPLLAGLLSYTFLYVRTWAGPDASNATLPNPVQAQPAAGAEVPARAYLLVRDRGLPLEERQAEWDRVHQEAGISTPDVLGARPEE